MQCDLIITVCAFNFATRNLATTCILTAAAHTRANIIVVANNMRPEFQVDLKALCDHCGIRWIYQEPFNFMRAFNDQIKSTINPYYGCFGQDVIFYPHWLENLIRCWDAEPDYFCVAPYSFNLWRGEPFVSLPFNPQDGILPTHPHCAAGMMFRRDKLFLYDENIQRAGDSDLYHFIQHNHLREGVCLSSRVDHFGQATSEGLTDDEQNKLYGAHPRDSALRLKEKWNLP